MATDETASKLVNERLEQIMGRWMWTGTEWRTVESLVRDRIAAQVEWYGKGSSSAVAFSAIGEAIRATRAWPESPYPQQAGGPSLSDR